jgi:hypothetical protein
MRKIKNILGYGLLLLFSVGVVIGSIGLFGAMILYLLLYITPSVSWVVPYLVKAFLCGSALALVSSLAALIVLRKDILNFRLYNK